MDIYEQIGQKHGFEVPVAYRDLDQAGVFSYYGAQRYAELRPAARRQLLHDRVRDGRLLYLDRVEWGTAADLLEYDAGTWVAGMIPFAGDGAGDQWCWYLPWAADGQVPVVIFRHDMWTIAGASPDFAAWIYDAVRENFTAFTDGTFQAADAGQVLATYAKILAPYIPPAWNDTLTAISTRPAHTAEDGQAGWICLNCARGVHMCAVDRAWDSGGNAARLQIGSQGLGRRGDSPACGGRLLAAALLDSSSTLVVH